MINKRLAITIITAFVLIGATLLAINFAKGYRLDFKQRKLAETGLLVANSFPSGASVYINDKLTTATNNTLNLAPGDYLVKIVKDGFIPWEKKLPLKKELVTQTNVRLFPSVPDLKSLTFNGAINMTPSPDGEKMAYAVATASSSLKNGLWILDLSSNPIAFSRDPRQIAQENKSIDFTKAKLVWSPNSKQILVWTSNASYLIDVDKINTLNSSNEYTWQLTILLSDWENEIKLKNQEKFKKLPLGFQPIASESAKNIYFSPDEEKVLYTAIKPAQLPDNMIPPLPASNNQPQQRNLEPDKIYVYDLKEDRNFYIADSVVQKEETQPTNLKKKTDTSITIGKRLDDLTNKYSPLFSQSIQWFPSSRHLIKVEADKIVIMEYDASNINVIYAGPFENNFVYPWPDSNKLLILTSLNSHSKLPANLYAIDLK